MRAEEYEASVASAVWPGCTKKAPAARVCLREREREREVSSPGLQDPSRRRRTGRMGRKSRLTRT